MKKPDSRGLRAVALRWEGRGAPRVIAKGQGEIAQRILALAQAHAVPLREDTALVEVLRHVDLGREIPVPLYQAVAEVIAFAYSLRSARPPPAVSH
jgi:flagellar biosynthesis protein